MGTRFGRAILAWALCTMLAACGGGGDGGDSASPAPTGSATVGGDAQTASVTIASPEGATVAVPPGALSAPLTVRVAANSTDAPTLPQGPVASQVFVVTPHGTRFLQPVTVRLPYDPQLLPAGATPVIAKAEQPGGPWRLMKTTINGDGTVSTET